MARVASSLAPYDELKRPMLFPPSETHSALARASLECYLYANVTTLGISSLLDSGVKWSAL